MPRATILIVETSSEIQEGTWSLKFYKDIAQGILCALSGTEPKGSKKKCQWGWYVGNSFYGAGEKSESIKTHGSGRATCGKSTQHAIQITLEEKESSE